MQLHLQQVVYPTATGSKTLEWPETTTSQCRSAVVSSVYILPCFWMPGMSAPDTFGPYRFWRKPRTMVLFGFSQPPSTRSQSRCDVMERCIFRNCSDLTRLRNDSDRLYVASCSKNVVLSEPASTSSTSKSSTKYGTPLQSPEQQPLSQHLTPHVAVLIPDNTSFLQRTPM